MSYESAKACAVVIDNNNSNNDDGVNGSNPAPVAEEPAREYSVASSSSSPAVLGKLCEVTLIRANSTNNWALVNANTYY